MTTYRIENGNVYEFSNEHRAFLFYCKVYALTKQELKEIKQQIKGGV